jgi:hypothetical protein
MAFEVGDHILAEKSGRRRRSARAPMRPPRHGVIERVLRGDPNPRYEIRWEDRSISIFSPSNGGIQLDPAHKKAKSKGKAKMETAE